MKVIYLVAIAIATTGWLWFIAYVTMWLIPSMT